jgi:hypothetical protein
LINYQLSIIEFKNFFQKKKNPLRGGGGGDVLHITSVLVVFLE